MSRQAEERGLRQTRVRWRFKVISILMMSFTNIYQQSEIKLIFRIDEYGDMVVRLVADKVENKSFNGWYRENYD
jgi:hypothetical protein